MVAALLAVPEVAGETGKPPQGIFLINFTVTVYGDLSASISISAKLADRNYIKEFSNDTNGRKEFSEMVLQLVYENLAMDIKARGGEAELRELAVLPNWSASLVVYVPDFLKRSDGKVRCPYSGTLNFVYANRVFGYTWDRFTLILPSNMTGVFVFPQPNERKANVFIWRNGDFIPLIEASVPGFTPEKISIAYRDGIKTFRATFRGNFTNSTIGNILERLRSSGARNVSWSLGENGTVLTISGTMSRNASIPYSFRETATSVNSSSTGVSGKKGEGRNAKLIGAVVASCAVACVLIIMLKRRSGRNVDVDGNEKGKKKKEGR
ncbi:MAG: hypothetical protein GXO14_00205 [Thermococci archaeon]|nr:hypothetical protein [Thermococci archaeon]